MAGEFKGPRIKAEGKLAIDVDKEGRVFAKREPFITLVMLSGGIDSVYSLVKLLRETDDIVIAHHVHLLNREERYRAEASSCENIVQYCRRNLRNFQYSQTVIDRRQLNSFGLDVFAVAGEVGPICTSYRLATQRNISRWILGFCTEEKAERDADPTAELRRSHLKNIVSASCFPNKPPELYNFPLVSKREEIEYLGPKLVDMCWYCRTPHYDLNNIPNACGNCKTCRLMKTASLGR